MAILLKLKAYLIAAAGFVVALLGTYLWARHTGKDAGESDQELADIKATDAAIQEQTQTLQEVKVHVQDLNPPRVPITVPAPIPASEGAQQIGSAEPGTAAGRLHSDWERKT